MTIDKLSESYERFVKMVNTEKTFEFLEVLITICDSCSEKDINQISRKEILSTLQEALTYECDIDNSCSDSDIRAFMNSFVDDMLYTSIEKINVLSNNLKKLKYSL